MIDEKEEKEPKVEPLHNEKESTEFDDALPPSATTTNALTRITSDKCHLPKEEEGENAAEE
eukprot:357295-Ditylum_brightwellii.AAC.1